MDRLPCEIIHKIFLLAVPKHYILSEKREATVLSILVPLYISHVCRSWRSIALSYGPLWSYLCLHFNFDSRDKTIIAFEKRKRNIKIFLEWLNRTNGTPLSFEINISVIGGYHEKFERKAEKIVETMLLLQKRWKDVSFKWTGLSPSSPSVRMNADLMPLLSSMVFQYETRSREHPPIIFDLSKSLQANRIVLCGHFVLQFAREQILTRLNACVLIFSGEPSRALAQYRQVLKLAPNLELFMCTSGVPNSDAPRLGPTPQDRLMTPVHKLYIQLPVTASHFIDQITAPFLRVLCYRGTSFGDGGAGDGGNTLLGFIQRSRPALTTLEVTGRYILDSTLAETLRLLPTLSKLRILHFNFRSRILQDLTLTKESMMKEGQEHILCPNLKTFSVSYRANENEEFSKFGALIQMVQSRIEFTKTLIREGVNGRFTKLDEPNVDWSKVVIPRRGAGSYILNFFGEEGRTTLAWYIGATLYAAYA